MSNESPLTKRQQDLLKAFEANNRLTKEKGYGLHALNAFEELCTGVGLSVDLGWFYIVRRVDRVNSRKTGNNEAVLRHTLRALNHYRRRSDAPAAAAAHPEMVNDDVFGYKDDGRNESMSSEVLHQLWIAIKNNGWRFMDPTHASHLNFAAHRSFAVWARENHVKRGAAMSFLRLVLDDGVGRKHSLEYYEKKIGEAKEGIACERRRLKIPVSEDW